MLALLTRWDVRPDRTVLLNFYPRRIAGVRLARFDCSFLARFLAAFLSLHFVYPPTSRVERPPKNSGNIMAITSDVLDCLSGKVAWILMKTHIGLCADSFSEARLPAGLLLSA